MDNNNDFEQQFKQNIKSSAATEAPQPVAYQSATLSSTSSKLPLVIAVALAVIVLIESIALVITLSNYFSVTNGDYPDDDYTYEDAEVISGNYVYDDDDNLKSVNLICTTDSGAQFIFTTDGKYQELDGSSAMTGFGTYIIKNGSLISLNASNGTSKVLYYDGFDVADGLTVYTCEEPTASTTTE